MDNKASSFYLRSCHFVLEATRLGKSLPQDFTHGLVDVEPLAADSFQKALGDVKEGHLARAKERLLKAFWMLNSDRLGYPEPAVCFVNPPVNFTAELDAVTLKTRQEVADIGQVLTYKAGHTELEVSLLLNSLQGSEVGFFNQVVVFCDGTMTKEEADWIVTTVKAHLLPGVTTLSFELPSEAKYGWLKLTQDTPDKDVDTFIEALNARHCLLESISSIEDDRLGIVTVVFGVNGVG